jgi:tetratricopeptide (TPR) repeat protein
MSSNPNERQFKSLLEAGKYDDAMNFLTELIQKDEISASEHNQWASACLNKLAASLFAEGSAYAKSKQYEKASESLNSVKALIMQNPELFGLDQKALSLLLTEWTQEMKKMSIHNMKDFPALQEKLLKMAKKTFKGKETLMILNMLLFALIFPALCESLPR